jgi:subtilisin family serine protease
VFVVAAGNSNGDACNLSPGRNPDVITVAASDEYDMIANFSERGSCVDLFAPGVNIMSTTNLPKPTIGLRNGTSMAAPHVAGLVALALAENNFTSVADVSKYIIGRGISNKIKGALNGAPNVLANNGF